MKGLPFTSLNAVTTGTGTLLPCQDARRVSWTLDWSGGVSAGAVVVEHSGNGSSWGELATYTYSAGKEGTSETGEYPVAGFVRARVGTTIVDGTVTLNFTKEFDS